MVRPNSQPFYHRLEVLFTATTDLSGRKDRKAFEAALTRLFKRELGKEVLPESVEIEVFDAEPGDPADLM